jgi:predicted TIM-barrel fold metal-dependent hydrolase
MICDSHIHFFSPTFYAGLAGQMSALDGHPYATEDLLVRLGWENPESLEAIADRWEDELDKHNVSRAAMIASLPGDAPAVADAVRRHPTRFVGFFMVDPTKTEAAGYVTRSLESGLRTVCLFPAMHCFGLHVPRVRSLFEIVAEHPGTAVFVHCGMLSVGVRKKLGLPSPFDARLGNPLDLDYLASHFPQVPIIVPHFGSGMLREALMLADHCANVHFDTSSSNAWTKYIPGLTLEQVFEAALATLGPDRLIFGTDSSFFPRGWTRDVYARQRSALDAIGADEAVQSQIFGGNFDRLFPIRLEAGQLTV